MQTNIYTAGKAVCLGLLFSLVSLFGQSQSLMVTDSIVHTQHPLSNGAVYLTIDSGQAPFTYHWNTGDTTNAIIGLYAGQYTVTITSATDTIVNTYTVAFYVNWALFNNTYENAAHALNCTADFEDDNIIQNFSGTMNRLKPDSSGYATFNFNRGDDYFGIVGLMPSLNYTEELSGLGIILAPDSFYDLPSGIYLVGDEEFTYLGNIVDSLPLQIRFEQNGDSIYVIKNGIECIGIAFDNNYTLSPAAAPFYDGNIITSTLCDFIPLVLLDIVNSNSPSCGYNSGGVEVEATGGYEPYTYQWSNGATTASLTNLEAGIYNATVFDAAGDSATTQYVSGYSIVWDTLSEFNEDGNGGIVAPTVSSDSTCFALASNRMEPWESGWVEFTIAAGDTFSGAVGLASDLNYDYFTTGAVVIIRDSSVHVKGSGLSDPSYMGEYIPGEGYKFRIESDNGLLRITKTISSTEVSFEDTVNLFNVNGLFPIVAGFEDGAHIAEVKTSFSCDRMRVSVSVTPAETFSSTGAASVSVIGGQTPYTYEWSSGQTTAGITGADVGEYAVTVTDQLGQSVVQSVFIGAYLDWDLKLNISEVDSHALEADLAEITQGVAQNITEYFGIAQSLNHLDKDSSGFVTFTFDSANAFTGLLGLFPILSEVDSINPLSITMFGLLSMYDTVTSEYVSAFMNLDIDDSDVEDVIGFGAVMHSEEPLNVTILRKNNYLTLIMNNLGRKSYYFPSTIDLTPTVFGLQLFDTGTIRIKHVTGSMRPQLKATATITANDCGESDQGEIALNVQGGIPPYTYVWSNAMTNDTITGLASADYTVTITDDASRQLIKTFSVGYNMIWDTLHQVTVNGDGSIQSDTSGGFAVAKNTLYTAAGEEGWVEFKIDDPLTFTGELKLEVPEWDTANTHVYVGVRVDSIGKLYTVSSDSSMDDIPVSAHSFFSYSEALIRLSVNSGVFKVELNRNNLVEFSNVNSKFLNASLVLAQDNESKVYAQSSFCVCPVTLQPPDLPLEVYSLNDTAYLFSIDSIQVGLGGDNVEWSFQQSFDSVYSAVGYANFSISVLYNASDTVWLRSKNLVQGCLSDTIQSVFSVSDQIESVPIIAEDTFVCLGELGRIYIENSQLNVTYKLYSDSVVIDSLSGTGKRISFTTDSIADQQKYEVVSFSQLNTQSAYQDSVTIKIPPEVGNPTFTNGSAILCYGSTDCYQAIATNSDKIEYSVWVGGAVINQESGCTNPVTSGFIIKAIASDRNNCTTTIKEMGVEVPEHRIQY